MTWKWENNCQSFSFYSVYARLKANVHKKLVWCPGRSIRLLWTYDIVFVYFRWILNFKITGDTFKHLFSKYKALNFRENAFLKICSPYTFCKELLIILHRKYKNYMDCKHITIDFHLCQLKWVAVVYLFEIYLTFQCRIMT